MEEENRSPKEKMKKLEEELEKTSLERDVLKWKEVDMKRTLVLKNGRNWRKEEKVTKWIAKHIGEVEFEMKKKMNRGQAGMQLIVFKEAFVKDYLWFRKDKVNTEGIYIVDEVLSPEEEKRDEKEKERLERVEREERRRETRDRGA